MPREQLHYLDPLDQIWISTAKSLGLTIKRGGESFVWVDGQGTIQIAHPSALDRDDCLAQIIFHEFCHLLVEGDRAKHLPDWGLDNESCKHEEKEHAALRTQALLLQRYGLRQALAPTTEFRQYYDALPEDPLHPRGIQQSVMAVEAIRRAAEPPFSPHLERALIATARIMHVAGAFTMADQKSLSSLSQFSEECHPTGLRLGPIHASCKGCSWRDLNSGFCYASKLSVSADWPSCELFEQDVRCETCGACCREGYDSVTVEEDDPVVTLHPELIRRHSSYLDLARTGKMCAALDHYDDNSGSEVEFPPKYRCRIYETRPRCCRQLQPRQEHCLTARRRAGLSISLCRAPGAE